MQTDQRIAHIATLSRRLRRSVWFIVGLLLLAAVLLPLTGIGAARIYLAGTQLGWGELTVSARATVVVCLLPIFAAILGLFWHCDRLLGLYERGVIFSAENARLIHRAGKLVVALAVLRSLLGPATLWLVARSGVPVEQVSIEPDIALLLVGLGILVVGHVMSLGAELAEDSALTI